MLLIVQQKRLSEVNDLFTQLDDRRKVSITKCVKKNRIHNPFLLKNLRAIVD